MGGSRQNVNHNLKHLGLICVHSKVKQVATVFAGVEGRRVTPGVAQTSRLDQARVPVGKGVRS